MFTKNGVYVLDDKKNDESSAKDPKNWHLFTGDIVLAEFHTHQDRQADPSPSLYNFGDGCDYSASRASNVPIFEYAWNGSLYCIDARSRNKVEYINAVLRNIKLEVKIKDLGK